MENEQKTICGVLMMSGTIFVNEIINSMWWVCHLGTKAGM